IHDPFKPQGCASAQRAVTIEAGARRGDAGDPVPPKARPHGQGGGGPPGGAPPPPTRGGLRRFPKEFRLRRGGPRPRPGAGRRAGGEVGTADGKIQIANACTNPDLFWALKGGGGGTFGVVTKVTLATHDLPEFIGGVEGKVRAKSDAAFRRLIDWFLRFYEK